MLAKYKANETLRECTILKPKCFVKQQLRSVAVAKKADRTAYDVLYSY